jgi:long-chain acyl-CoA synthetase
MIILTSGENINPANIEEYYARSSYVDEICVFSAKEMGFLEQAEQLAAVIYPKEEYRTKKKLDCLIRDDFSELGAGLRDFCRIKQIIIAKEPLSKTSLGKTIRGQVKEQYCGKGVCERRTNTCVELSISDKELMAMPVCKEVLAYFSERFKKEVNLNDHLEFDLGIDSLGKIELLMGLQEKFHIQSPKRTLRRSFIVTPLRSFLRGRCPLLKILKNQHNCLAKT